MTSVLHRTLRSATVAAVGAATASAQDGEVTEPADHARVGWFGGHGRSAAPLLLGHIDSRARPFVVFGATGEDVVRLVTWAGAFDRGARSDTDNLVVHAVRRSRRRPRRAVTEPQASLLRTPCRVPT